MIRSRTARNWPQGYWKFPGGIERSSDDGDLRETVIREMAEETSITRVSLHFTSDKPIVQKEWISDSNRLGVRTKYDFNGFAVTVTKPDLKSILKRGEMTIPTSRRDEVLMWVPWSELLQQEYYAKEAPELLKELSRLKFEDVSLTARIKRTARPRRPSNT
jgi:8-oxo-dGTP pyrophosphatase MutT (NUDIX family)